MVVPEGVEPSYSKLRRLAPGSAGRTMALPQRVELCHLASEAKVRFRRWKQLVGGEGIEPPYSVCRTVTLPLR